MIVPGGRHTARERRRIVAAFRKAGALAPEHAKTLVQLGLSDSRIMRNFVDRRIVREVRAGDFYLDDDAYRQYRAMMLRWMIVPLAIAAALVIYAIVAGTR